MWSNRWSEPSAGVLFQVWLTIVQHISQFLEKLCRQCVMSSIIITPNKCMKFNCYQVTRDIREHGRGSLDVMRGESEHTDAGIPQRYPAHSRSPVVRQLYTVSLQEELEWSCPRSVNRKRGGRHNIRAACLSKWLQNGVTVRRKAAAASSVLLKRKSPAREKNWEAVREVITLLQTSRFFKKKKKD